MMLKGSSNCLFLFEFFYILVSWFSCTVLYIFGWHPMRIVSACVLHHTNKNPNIGIVPTKFLYANKSSLTLWVLYLYAENLFKTTYLFVPFSSLQYCSKWLKVLYQWVGKCFNIYFYSSIEDCREFFLQTNELKNALFFDCYFYAAYEVSTFYENTQFFTVGINYHPLIRSICVGSFKCVRGGSRGSGMMKIVKQIVPQLSTFFSSHAFDESLKQSNKTLSYQMFELVSHCSFPPQYFNKVHQLYHEISKFGVVNALVDPVLLSSFSLVFPTLAAYQLKMYDLSLFCGCLGISCVLYHRSYEQSENLEFINKYVTSFYSLYFILRVCLSTTFAYSLFHLFHYGVALSLLFFMKHHLGFYSLVKKWYRTNNYQLYMSFYYIFLSLAMYMQCWSLQK